jgi:AcrR family transcriptional regulator
MAVDPLTAASSAGRSGDLAMLRRIVAAAEDCFRQYGIHRTRMEDVAERVGLARPNLYRFVPSKDELINLVQVQHTVRMDEERRRRIPLKGPVADILVESFVIGIELVKQDDPFLATSISMDAHVRRLAESEGSDHVTPRPDYWYPIFDYGRSRGEIRPDLKNEEILHWIASQSVLFSERSELFGDEARRRWYTANFVISAILVSPQEHRSSAPKGAAAKTPPRRSGTTRKTR